MTQSHGTRWDALTDVARRCVAEKQFDKAEEAFLAALREAEQFGESDPRVAATLNALARVYHRRSKFFPAAALLHRLLALKEREHGEDHPELAGILNNLADMYGKLGDARQELDLRERALAIRTAAGEAEGPPLEALRSRIAELTQTIGEERAREEAVRNVRKRIPVPTGATDLPLILPTPVANPRLEPLPPGLTPARKAGPQPTAAPQPAPHGLMPAPSPMSIAPLRAEPIAPPRMEPITPSRTEPIAPLRTDPIAPMRDDPITPLATEPLVPVPSEPMRAQPVMPVPLAPIVPSPPAALTPVRTDPIVPSRAEPIAPTPAQPVAPPPPTALVLRDKIATPSMPFIERTLPGEPLLPQEPTDLGGPASPASPASLPFPAGTRQVRTPSPARSANLIPPAFTRASFATPFGMNSPPPPESVPVEAPVAPLHSLPPILDPGPIAPPPRLPAASAWTPLAPPAPDASWPEDQPADDGEALPDEYSGDYYELRPRRSWRPLAIGGAALAAAAVVAALVLGRPETAGSASGELAAPPPQESQAASHEEPTIEAPLDEAPIEEAPTPPRPLGPLEAEALQLGLENVQGNDANGTPASAPPAASGLEARFGGAAPPSGDIRVPRLSLDKVTATIDAAARARLDSLAKANDQKVYEYKGKNPRQ